MAGPARPEDSPGADEPEVVSEEEAPEDDFFEADASAELTEDEDDQVEEYASDDEEVSLDAIIIAHNYCSCPAVDFVWRSELDESVLPPSKIFNYDEVVHLVSCFICSSFLQQERENAAAKEVARKERERLKNQERMRKEQVEKMRSQLNTDAAQGEVRYNNNYSVVVTRHV